MALSPASIFGEKIPERLKQRADKISSINSVYQFDITGEGGGTWVIDLTQPGGAVTQGASEAAKCIVTMDASNFSDLIEGKLNPQMAFMTGKLKVKGDMGLALKLGAIL
ncbi:MAG: SCP2 sterol-binding domain-containing protein [Deltaproteobacteria bacterium]|nr:SCP2 sterol-binding domain-containing protein [Deltaproteobacteria bacterium]